MQKISVIAWDFDGVINRNWSAGADAWAQDFASEFGASLDSFYHAVFAENFHPVLIGAEPLVPRIARWTKAMGLEVQPEKVLDYWFAKDADPDPAVLAMIDAVAAKGLRQIIATNNEQARSSFIAEGLGLARRVGPVFASGHLGHAKPAAEFFAAVTAELGVDPGDILLIDDRLANVEGARSFGWNGFHFHAESRAELESLLKEVCLFIESGKLL